MEIEKASKIAFAYTVKSLGEDKNPNYKPFFDILAKFSIPIEYMIEERDSKGKTHWHGIILLEKGFYRKRIMIRGFHTKLVELYNRAGWIKYIEKDLQYSHLEQQAEEIPIDEGYETPKEERFVLPVKNLFISK